MYYMMMKIDVNKLLLPSLSGRLGEKNVTWYFTNAWKIVIFRYFLAAGLYKLRFKSKNNLELELYFEDQVRKMPIPFTHTPSKRKYSNIHNLKLNYRHVYLLTFVWL